MNVIRCKNGHFYDGDSYSTCPHCGETAIANPSTVPNKEEKRGFWGRSRKEKVQENKSISEPLFATPCEDFGDGSTPTDVLPIKPIEEPSNKVLNKNPTLDFWETSAHSVSPIIEENSEVDAPNVEHLNEESNILFDSGIIEDNNSSDEIIENNISNEVEPDSESTTSLREAVKKVSATNEGMTMSYFSAAVSNSSSSNPQIKSPSEPVVGWIVCIGGIHLGDSFSIFVGKNSIGRSSENRIVIPNDNSISRVKHALIVYEPKKRNFYLQPGDSSGLTYLNDDYITESHKLSAKDIIELGDCKFMFIPLCSDDFSWEDYISKGE